MYSDRRGNGQKPPRTKPSRQKTHDYNPLDKILKPPLTIAIEFVQGVFVQIFCTIGSGVQRLLDARGHRGSWMPSKIISIHPAKFRTTFFSVVKFQDNSLSGCPLPCCIMPRDRYFSLHFLPFTYIFLH